MLYLQCVFMCLCVCVCVCVCVERDVVAMEMRPGIHANATY